VRRTENEVGEEQGTSPLTRVTYRVASSVAITNNRCVVFRQNAADRQLDLLKPENATKAREALPGIIERATERLTLKADAHRQRDELQAELAADVLAFDDSPEGERLRRYELAHGRSVARAIDLLQKYRRIANPIDPGLTNGAVAEFDIQQQAHAMTEEKTTNEPTVDCENVTNEPRLAVDGENGACVGAFGPGASVASAPVANAGDGPVRTACHDPWFKGVSRPCEGAWSVNRDQARCDSQMTASWVTENEDWLSFDLGR
jgi:hypothetical protein